MGLSLGWHCRKRSLKTHQWEALLGPNLVPHLKTKESYPLGLGWWKQNQSPLKGFLGPLKSFKLAVALIRQHYLCLPSVKRAGFSIREEGDVGKGRTLMGLIWEYGHHGRRKVLWIFVGPNLSCQKDLDDMGATCVNCML